MRNLICLVIMFSSVSVAAACAGSHEGEVVVEATEAEVSVPRDRLANQQGPDRDAERLGSLPLSVWSAVIGETAESGAWSGIPAGELVTLEIRELEVVVRIQCEARNVVRGDPGFTRGTIVGGGCVFDPGETVVGPLGPLTDFLLANPEARVEGDALTLLGDVNNIVFQRGPGSEVPPTSPATTPDVPVSLPETD